MKLFTIGGDWSSAGRAAGPSGRLAAEAALAALRALAVSPGALKLVDDELATGRSGFVEAAPEPSTAQPLNPARRSAHAAAADR